MGTVHQCLRIGLHFVDVHLLALPTDTSGHWSEYELLRASILVRCRRGSGSMGGQSWQTLDWSKYHDNGFSYESVVIEVGKRNASERQDSG